MTKIQYVLWHLVVPFLSHSIFSVLWELRQNTHLHFTSAITYTIVTQLKIVLVYFKTLSSFTINYNLSFFQYDTVFLDVFHLEFHFVRYVAIITVLQDRSATFNITVTVKRVTSSRRGIFFNCCKKMLLILMLFGLK